MLTKKEMFFEYLFNDPECYCEPRLAFEKAGYEPQYFANFMRENKDDILKRSADEIAMNVPKAVSRLVSSMDEDGSIPKADIRLKAVESVLDRAGLVKRQDVNVSVSEDTPIFFIPSKVHYKVDTNEENN